MHLVHAAEQIVQVAHDVLIRAGQKYPEVIRLLVQRVQREEILHVLQIDEGGNFPVRIARDIDQDRVDGGSLLQPVQRRDREQLLQRPVVEQRLEDGEVADVLVGEKLVQL